MSPSSDALETSYAACRQVARRAQSSFYPSFFLLRGPQRKAMEAIYAFMRHTDDLADNNGTIDERREAIGRWRHAVAEVMDWAVGRVGDSEIVGDLTIAQSPGLLLLPALADVRRRFRIPAEHFFAVLDGVEMDLGECCFRTYSDLAEYCDRVASAVGLACLHVWGFRDDEAFPAARCCGRALQLTNILRDLKEDASRGRVYLPRDDMDACAYSLEDLTRGVADERFDRLMAVEIQRARQLYHDGAELFAWLEPPGQRIFGMMIATYWRLLERIAGEPRRVLRARVRLPAWEKLRIAFRWTCLPARRSALP